MKTGKSKVSPKAQTALVSNIDHFQRSDLRAEDLQGIWQLMGRPEGAKPMAVVTCPVCTEFGLLSDHIIGEDGGVTPSMDCQNEDCSYHTFIHLDNWDHGVLDNQGEVARMAELPNLRQQRKEWESWKDVCAMLKDMGVVTVVDLDAKPANRDTAGVRLLAGLRAWGDSLVELRGVKLPIPDPVMLGLVTQIVPGLLKGGEPLPYDALAGVVKTARAIAEEILKQCSPQQ